MRAPCPRRSDDGSAMAENRVLHHGYFGFLGGTKMPTIIIDYDACVPCGDCVEACTVRLLVEEVDDDGNVIVRPRSDRVENTEENGSTIEYYSPGCSNCRVCYISCPCEAIDIIPELEDED